MKEYVTNEKGTSFSVGTDEKVMSIIQRAIYTRSRIRVFYGDKETGKDWLEVYDTIGRVGRSMGDVRVPILINNRRSFGGTIILTDCIVKITIDKQVVYKHPRYHCPVERRGCELYNTNNNTCVFRASSEDKAIRELQFFLGERNSH